MTEWELAARAFTIDGPRIAATALVALGTAIAVVYLLWTEGRDYRWHGQVVAAIPPSPDDIPRRVPLFERRVVPAEYAPPEDLPPALLGVLVDERMDARDIGATVVHLARRGVLTVERIPTGRWRSPDWRIRYDRSAPTVLHPYERTLLEGWFERRSNEVRFSTLQRPMVSIVLRMQRTMDDEVMERGWFMDRLDATRQAWRDFSFRAMVAAYLLQVLMIGGSDIAIVTTPLPVGALLLFVFRGNMGRRTPRGHALTTRALGFRRFILDAEPRRAAFAEAAGAYYDYLPYAIAFGATRQWARKFGQVVPSHAYVFHWAELRKSLRIAETVPPITRLEAGGRTGRSRRAP
jgi:hypothetical protein